MNQKILSRKLDLPINIDAIASSIVKSQFESGEIPWHDGGKTDPWDMVEAIMGLTIGGYIDEARNGFDWLKSNQHEDGSWYSAYKNGVPQDKTHDTNMSSYIAVGVFHHYLITNDMSFLENMWSTVRAGIDFAMNLQAEGGEIYWAKSPEGKVDPMSLLTGSSSVYMSLKCAMEMARRLNHTMPHWETGFHKLGNSLLNRSHAYNISKSRFSMDWFYPILSGAIKGDKAQKRIDKYWKKYVVEDQGIRCVADEPWVTVAETAEFILTLSAMGNQNLARIIFNWIHDRRYEDGSYWCGFTFPDMVIWPEDKLTWTNAVILMAADALYNLTPAGQIFNHKSWTPSGFSACLE
ncbi:MAG: phenyltransferase domain-containing protein [Proteobacteria bacterium]|nr:phenyltransferase domain-containing protein [Pseudomonadota bacterium]